MIQLFSWKCAQEKLSSLKEIQGTVFEEISKKLNSVVVLLTEVDRLSHIYRVLKDAREQSNLSFHF